MMNLRKLARKFLNRSCFARDIDLGHGYFLHLECLDANIGVELGVEFPFPWGGDRDHGGEPVPHFLGGLSIAPGQITVTDQGRDILWQKGRNLLADFAFKD